MQDDELHRVYEVRRRRYISSKLRSWNLSLTKIQEQPDRLQREVALPTSPASESRLTFAYSKYLSAPDCVSILPSDSVSNYNDGASTNSIETYISLDDTELSPDSLAINPDHDRNNFESSPYSSTATITVPLPLSESLDVAYGKPPATFDETPSPNINSDIHEPRFNSTLPARFKSRKPVNHSHNSSNDTIEMSFNTNITAFGRPPNTFDGHLNGKLKHSVSESHSTLPARFKVRRNESMESTPTKLSYSSPEKLSKPSRYVAAPPHNNSTLPALFKSRRSGDSRFTSLTTRIKSGRSDVCARSPRDTSTRLDPIRHSKSTTYAFPNSGGPLKRRHSEHHQTNLSETHRDAWSRDTVQRDGNLLSPSENVCFDQPISISINTIMPSTPCLVS